MKEEAIYHKMESLNIKIDHIYGEESNLDFSEINQSFNKEKLSLLVLRSDSVSFNLKKKRRNEINVTLEIN